MPPSKNTKDIYSSRTERKSPLDGPRPSARDQVEWLRKSSGSRWSTGLFVLLILVLIAFLVAVITYQHRQLRATRERTPRAAPPERRLSLEPAQDEHPRDGMEPEGQALLDDDWADREPEAEAGRYPLTARWVQEAAQQLRRGHEAFEAENWREALRHYTAARSILPGMEGLGIPMGLSHLRLREFGPAEEAFLDEIERGTVTAALLNNLAVAHMAREHYAEAEQRLLQATELDADYLPARHNLSLLYYRTGNLEKAADAFRDLFRREPLSPDHIHLFAVTLLQLEAWDEAAAILSESARQYPEAPIIRFRLAEAHAQASNLESAMDALRAGVDMVDARLAMRWLSRSEFDPLRRRPEFTALVDELTAGRP